MPKKKSEKKIKIRVGRAGRAGRAVSKKPSSKQIVNVYVTPSGTYATPIRSSSVLESPMPIPQQPSVFQPIFPTQTFQQQQQQEPQEPKERVYGPEVQQLIERQRQGLASFENVDPFAERARLVKEKELEDIRKQMEKISQVTEERLAEKMRKERPDFIPPSEIQEEKMPVAPVPGKKMKTKQADYYFKGSTPEQIQRLKDQDYIFPSKWKP